MSSPSPLLVTVFEPPLPAIWGAWFACGALQVLAFAEPGVAPEPDLVRAVLLEGSWGTGWIVQTAGAFLLLLLSMFVPGPAGGYGVGGGWTIYPPLSTVLGHPGGVVAAKFDRRAHARAQARAQRGGDGRGQPIFITRYEKGAKEVVHRLERLAWDTATAAAEAHTSGGRNM